MENPIDQVIEWINAIPRLSPPVLLVFLLVGLGYVLKLSKIFSNKYIPLSLAFLGSMVYPFVTRVAEINHQVRYPIVADICVGFLCGLAAVGINQAWRQLIPEKFKKFILPEEPETDVKSSKPIEKEKENENK
jgi:hypothetical protein